jgi:hypothetical protein
MSTSMKAISASIIVLSGSILYGIGAAFTRSETQMVTCALGFLLALFGFVAWIMAMGNKSP